MKPRWRYVIMNSFFSYITCLRYKNNTAFRFSALVYGLSNIFILSSLRFWLQFGLYLYACAVEILNIKNQRFAYRPYTSAENRNVVLFCNTDNHIIWIHFYQIPMSISILFLATFFLATFLVTIILKLTFWMNFNEFVNFSIHHENWLLNCFFIITCKKIKKKNKYQILSWLNF